MGNLYMSISRRKNRFENVAPVGLVVEVLVVVVAARIPALASVAGECLDLRQSPLLF
jgi:hypothetical protein